MRLEPGQVLPTSKGGHFSKPCLYASNRRPIYDHLLQEVCLEVRRTNCGINGKPILFYARRHNTGAVTPKPTKANAKRPTSNQHKELIGALQALGLANVTPAQIDEAVKELFPQGTKDAEHADVIRAVFLHLRRKNSADNVGR
jgi:hypothetical protein